MKIALVGDVMLGRGVNEALRGEEPRYPWGDTLPILEAAGMRICNLECAISDSGSPQRFKRFRFRTDAKNLAVLGAAGIDVVSLANNHVLDYGEAALTETLDTLDGAGIARAGAGRNRDEARSLATMTRDGFTAGMLAFTDNEPGWEAEADRPGVWYVPIDAADERAQELFELVVRAASQVDFLIVSAHWGPNWGWKPPPEHPPFAHRLIEAGADLVFGHSCHVFRGLGLHEGRPIIYSAGDFIDDYAVDPEERNDRSLIWEFDVDTHRVTAGRFQPVFLEHCWTRLADPPDAQAIRKRFTELSADLGTTIEPRPDGALDLVLPRS